MSTLTAPTVRINVNSATRVEIRIATVLAKWLLEFPGSMDLLASCRKAAADEADAVRELAKGLPAVAEECAKPYEVDWFVVAAVRSMLDAADWPEVAKTLATLWPVEEEEALEVYEQEDAEDRLATMEAEREEREQETVPNFIPTRWGPDPLAVDGHERESGFRDIEY